MRRGIGCALIGIIAVPSVVLSQGIETPPLTSFHEEAHPNKPDTTLPEVNVPEFIITGKSEANVERFKKETIEIDSSYFQSKDLGGIELQMPPARALSTRVLAGQPINLFARLSSGSYATSTYLLSGSGDFHGALLDASIDGNYTSGYTTETIRREFSMEAGIQKDMIFDGDGKAINSAEVEYSRGSYFLYGTGISNLLRTTNQFDFGLYSNLNLGTRPVIAGLRFDRFSVNDYWKDVESKVTLKGSTTYELNSGSISLDGNLALGNHTTHPPSYLLASLSGFDKSLFNFALAANYTNKAGDLSYTAGLAYYQYTDDLNNGVAKIYPDLRASYMASDKVSLFGRFFGEIRKSNLSAFLDENNYVEASFPLVNSQDYANITLGADWKATEKVLVSPQFSFEGSRFYPMYSTFSSAIMGTDTSQVDNRLLYANKAKIFTASLTARYSENRFGADATLNIRSGTADSLSSIPYLAPFDIMVGADYAINPQFHFKPYLTIVANRYSDLALRNKLRSIWLLNFHAAYDLKIGAMPIEIFADGKNIFDQDYTIWQGYPEFPIVFSVGISGKVL